MRSTSVAKPAQFAAIVCASPASDAGAVPTSRTAVFIGSFGSWDLCVDHPVGPILTRHTVERAGECIPCGSNSRSSWFWLPIWPKVADEELDQVPQDGRGSAGPVHIGITARLGEFRWCDRLRKR